MNNVVLMGRLTKNPELNRTQSGNSYVRFTLAVNRITSDKDNKEADFINCIAWNKRAEVIVKYFEKGDRILLNGSIQTYKYEKGNETKYSFDVLISSLEFIEKKEFKEKITIREETNIDDEFPF